VRNFLSGTFVLQHRRWWPVEPTLSLQGRRSQRHTDLLARPSAPLFWETAKEGHSLPHTRSRILLCRPHRWQRRLPWLRLKRYQQSKEEATQWPMDSRSREGKDLHQA